MRAFACICCVAVLIGCADTQEDTDAMAGDTAGMAPAPAPAPPPLSVADVAGTWTVRGMAENSDSVLVTYTLVADEDSTWTMKFTDRPDTVLVRVVTVAGDSLVTHAGPYRSVLRRGVMVTTHGVFRLQDGRLVGRTTARYTTNRPDSVLIVRTEGTRGPSSP